jgi:pectate lyase
MPNILRNSCSSLLLCCYLFVQSLQAQTPASSLWQLTADQNPTVTGDLVAIPQTLSNLQIKYQDGVQRSSPSGVPAGTWPGEANENSTRYLQFAVTPSAGHSLTINVISLYLYVNSGSNMRANIYYSTDPSFGTRQQIGSTLVLSSTIPTTPNVTAELNCQIDNQDTFYLRIYPWYTTATTGKYTIVKSVLISGTTSPAIYLLAVPPELTNFFQEKVGRPSAIQSYALSGMNLTDSVTIIPPPPFAISTGDGTTWVKGGDSLRLPVREGKIVGQPISIAVCLNADTVGVYHGLIVHRSSGAATEYVKLTGIFLAAEPTKASIMTIDSITSTSAVISCSGGNGSHRIIALKACHSIDWLPTDGVPPTGVDANYQAAHDQGDGTKIVYDSTGWTVTVTGLALNTQYTAAVFEYNVHTSNTHNYLTNQYGHVTFSTAIVPVLTSTPDRLNFGSLLPGQQAVKSYHLTGKYLQSVDTITISAPIGFGLALEPQSDFVPTLTMSTTGETIDTSIYVQFAPPSLGSFTGDIIHNLSGAASLIMPVTGKCVTTYIDNSAPVGFATIEGGTTGGLGGDTVVITTAHQLYDLVQARENKSPTPLIIYIAGTLKAYPEKIPVKRTANLSIIGLGGDAGLLGFGMKISDCYNIIVRNLTIADAHVDEKDALEIDHCHNIWIDHCSFTDSPANDPTGSNHDGLLDIKNGSYNITISYNHFWNHRQTCLLGHTRDQVSDTVMKVTYYRNWFDGTYSRQPRIRYARAHILNNLFTNIGSYGVGVTCQAQVLVEDNYFENTPVPILISQVNDPAGTLSGDPAGFVKTSSNYCINSGAIIENLSGFDFEPHQFYSYDLIPAEMVKDLVIQNAGAGMLDSAVVAVIPNALDQPRHYSLAQNYPNPFNATTTIKIQLPEAQFIRLVIYDIRGEVVAVLGYGYYVPGEYKFIFTASHLPSGLYFCQYQAGHYRQTRKLLLIK